MKKVALRQKRLVSYRRFIDPEQEESIRESARALAGLRVLHINATPNGGGVAEILHSLVPLMKDVDVNVDWYVLDGDDEFFRITKTLHNQLQGEPGELSREDADTYLRTNERIHESMRAVGADLWVVHDPQPAVAGAMLDGSASKVWRSHIDTSAPNRTAWTLLSPYVPKYDAVIYSDQSYCFPDAGFRSVFISPPAIDPLSRKNRRMSRGRGRSIVSRLGIDPDRPLVSQVARFDKWKDPIGVIEAYRLARDHLSELQLALVGVMAAQDDPEALEMYLAVKDAAGEDADIHIYVDPRTIGSEEVAAFQAASDVVIQKSLREGFGLSVTEAMWQGTPVLAGDTPGLRLQVKDGESGFIVKDVVECAARIVQLLEDKSLARHFAHQARDTVRTQYLLPRFMLDELNTYRGVLSQLD